MQVQTFLSFEFRYSKRRKKDKKLGKMGKSSWILFYKSFGFPKLAENVWRNFHINLIPVRKFSITLAAENA